ncbi:hypothetical protein JKP88DRAFT_251702 [Tribonema minus]|uniref:Uncharacterized protein n=1 Tax=Tribonema minus TaxID=303371 RepID=A0A835ZCV5_9STRA|nr:hypothetical protein JKP88DRAFT_251702 [Tribonema minus]
MSLMSLKIASKKGAAPDPDASADAKRAYTAPEGEAGGDAGGGGGGAALSAEDGSAGDAGGGSAAGVGGVGAAAVIEIESDKDTSSVYQATELDAAFIERDAALYAFQQEDAIAAEHVCKRRNGAYSCRGRHQNRYVKFTSRSTRGAARDVKAPSLYFWDKSLKSFKEELEFVVQEKGGSVELHVAPLPDGLKSVLTKKQQASFWWTAQHVCKEMMDRGTKCDMDRFIAEVRRKGVCETLLDKFKWHDVAYDEHRELSLHKSAVEFVASSINEIIPPVTKQALQLWNSYDGPASEYPAYSSDTALLASHFGVKTGGGVTPGMQLLLDKRFFVTREFEGVAYYKTPDVEPFSEKTFVEHDAGQLAAMTVMFKHHCTVVTGLAGCGKTATTSTFLRSCESAGVIAPSHAAKTVIQEKCAQAGCGGLGFEVVQFTRLMGKARSSDRSIAFLEAMGWVDEGEKREGEDRVPAHIDDVAYAIDN